MVMQMITRAYFPQAIKPIRFTLNKKIKELNTYTEKREDIKRITNLRQGRGAVI